MSIATTGFVAKTDEKGVRRRYCLIPGCPASYHDDISKTILQRHYQNKHVNQPTMQQSVQTSNNRGMQEALACCFASLNLPIRAVDTVIN